MMIAVVLMAGFMTSCGSDDDNNSGPLGTYTIGMTVSEQGGLSDVEVSALNSVLKNMEQTFTNATEFKAKNAFEESFKAIDTSKSIYNLNGVRMQATSVDALPSGIYIVNGKKIVK